MKNHVMEKCDNDIQNNMNPGGVDPEATRAYYAALTEGELCGCGYCASLRRQAAEAYPELAAYLAGLGVDIAKPLETSPVDLAGYVEYSCDYLVMGRAPAAFGRQIGDVQVSLSDIHPSTGVAAAHFVLNAGPLRLPWHE